MKKILLGALALTLMAGGCQTASPAEPAPTADIPKEVTSPTEETARFANVVDSNSAVCTNAPRENEGIGGLDYPVAEGYEMYDRFLGAFFTQYQCGEDRFRDFVETTGAGSEDTYDMGVSLLLKEPATVELLDVFEQIGFTCEEDTSSELCLDWELDKTVSHEELIRLEPFSEEILGTDCINCG